MFHERMARDQDDRNPRIDSVASFGLAACCPGDARPLSDRGSRLAERLSQLYSAFPLTRSTTMLPRLGLLAFFKISGARVCH